MDEEETEAGESQDFLSQVGGWFSSIGDTVGGWAQNSGINFGQGGALLGGVVAAGLAYFMGRRFFGNGILGSIFGIGLSMLVFLFTVSGLGKMFGSGDDAPEADAAAQGTRDANNIELTDGQEDIVTLDLANVQGTSNINIQNFNAAEGDRLVLTGDVTTYGSMDTAAVIALLSDRGIALEDVDISNLSISAPTASANDQVQITIGQG